MGKYSALGAYLSGLPADVAHKRLYFHEVEAIVGPLPPSARNHQAWWGNHEGNLQAISWMNAGWKVNALNLADQHLTFSRTGGPTVAARAVTAPATMSVGASRAGAGDPMSEATTQSLVVSHLVREGWQITRVADTASRERGVGILATRQGRTLAVEVKGYPGVRHPDPARAHEAKAVSPATQARHYFADAVMHVLTLWGEDPGRDVAIAVPDMLTYRNLHQRLRPAFARLGVAVWFVAPDGTIG